MYGKAEVCFSYNMLSKSIQEDLKAMTKRVFAYIRVSAKDQNEARQLAAIKAFPDPITTIYIDKQSGKNFDRKEYRRVVRRLKEGDVLPSMRLLAKELHISVITTKRVYEDLEREGFISTVVGKGSFVAKTDNELLKEEKLRQIEEHLQKATDIARGCGITLEEVSDVLRMLYEEV